jgi:hypothetical protein
MTPIRVKSIAFAGALIAVAAVSGPPRVQAAPKNRQVQRVAVAQFEASSSSHARNVVLETLSEHEDVEVVSLEDIGVAAKRLGVDAKSPASRAKLSEELGITAWIDGAVEDGQARFSLHSPDGRTLATTSIQGHRESVADGLAGPKVWEAMGPILSVRERAKRALEAQQELAVKKVQAREQELVRLRQQVEARAASRDKQLKAAQSLAREKRAAFVAELDRQEKLIADRTAVADRERKAAERKQTEAEEAEFLASLHESSGPPDEAGAEPAAASPSRMNAWGGGTAGTNVWAASAKSTAPVAAAAPRPAANPTMSPWLMTQGGDAQPVPVQPQNAPRAAAPAAANQDGLSPATRAWLAQQGLH